MINVIFISFSGVCIPPVLVGNASAGPVVRLPELCDNDHREEVRDPVKHFRHHRVHVRNWQRHHSHIRLLPWFKETHTRLDWNG